MKGASGLSARQNSIMERNNLCNEKVELIKKGAVQIFSERGLMERLNSGKKLKIKFGADPSRPDLHLGHSVPLRKLRLFQDLGHEVIFVIGDFTGMIGDPSGRSKTRPSLTLEQTRESGETYLKQVTKILIPEKTHIAYNSQWLNKMEFADVINLASKYTVARIMEREDFKNRYAGNQPIGIHELLYPLIQGYDSVAINADVEIGGTDQTFNLLVGRSLQADFGQKPQEVITFPLLVGLDGKEKMSKSFDNYIGVDEPPKIIFEKCMKVPDGILHDYFVLTTDTTEKEASILISEDIRNAHFEYAKQIVMMYHGKEAAIGAENHYREVAGGAVPRHIPVLRINKREITICELLKLAGFAGSNNEARRNINGKGVKINGTLVENSELIIKLEEPVVLQFGKNRFVEVRNEA